MKKNIIKYSFLLSVAGFGLQSCISDAPFMAEGEGTVSVTTEMHSDVQLATRSLDAQTKAELEDNLTIYIENKKGVIRKYKGKNDLPNSITLNAGEYAIEGWTGDSVSASYDRKFYRGYQKFTVEGGINSEVKFDVNIANVIVSIDAETLNQDFHDFKVTFSHSRGLLTFDRQSTEEGKKGYFMMPNADKDLYYKVELKSQLGEDIVKEGTLANVERAHEYSIKILSEAPENNLGAGQIRLEIMDIPVLDKKLNVYPAPIYYAQLGAEKEEFDIENTQIDFSEGNFSDVRLRIVGYGSLTRLALTFPEPFTGMETVNGVNLRNNNDAKTAAVDALVANHIIYGAESSGKVYDDAGATTYDECWITFEKEFFSALPVSTTEYVIQVAATDGMENPASSTLSIRIANAPEAVDKKMVESMAPADPYDDSKPMAILATSAELGLIVRSEEATGYGIEYRKKNSSDSYTQVPLVSPNALNLRSTIKISDLEPGTEYEYRAYCDGYTEQNPKTFRTEDVYLIPNGNMNDWSTKGNVNIPGPGGNATYWDSGNHGSFLVSAALGGKNVTMPDDNFIPGNRVAKLQTGTVMSVMAAGNLFVGQYISNDGTQGADLNFGREFNGSHPSALKFKMNYRPGKVDKYTRRDETAELVQGENDHGQVYVAIASAQSELHTAKGVMFDPHGDNILGYGQITWNENIGATNQMADIIIPINYYEKAKDVKATHIIIVCSASKYGDYFSGSSTSVMYLDDFEFEYGDIHWDE